MARADLPIAPHAAVDSPTDRAVQPTFPYRALGVAWLVMVMYGSLLPFEFHNSAGIAAAFEQSWQLRWYIGPTPDLMLNLMLYVPAGLLLRMGVKRRGAGRAWQFAGPIVTVAMVSLLLEWTQMWMPGRFSSSTDLLLNVTGGVIGAVIADAVLGVTRLAALQLHTVWRWLRRTGHELLSHVPARIAFLTGIVALLTTAWIALPQANAALSRGWSAGNWIPFLRHFELPYDQATTQILLTAAMYGTVALVIRAGLSILMRHATRRIVIDAIALGLAVAFTALAAMRLGTMDVTESLIAVAAAAAIIIAPHVARRYIPRWRAAVAPARA